LHELCASANLPRWARWSFVDFLRCASVRGAQSRPLRALNVAMTLPLFRLMLTVRFAQPGGFFAMSLFLYRLIGLIGFLIGRTGRVQQPGFGPDACCVD
jgi:hypothetical protein